MAADPIIVDFRLRPPLEGFRRGIMYADPERTRGICSTFAMEPSRTLWTRSIDDALAEMDESGITIGVIPVRRGTASADVSNDEVAAFVASHRDRFVGFLSPDPDRIASAADEVADLVARPGCPGIVLEPGLWEQPRHLNDEALFGVYERCQELDVPVLLMAGGTAGPDISYTAPIAIDQVAGRFPRLTLIAAHGGWPWVTEILHVAFRRPNLYLSPDMYLFGGAGWRDYVDAGNGFLRDRLLFGSSFPFLPLVPAVERFRELFRPEVLPGLLGRNAERLVLERAAV